MNNEKDYDLSGGIYIEINPLNYLYLALAVIVPLVIYLVLKHSLKKL